MWASPLVTKIRLGMRSCRQAAALRASFALSTARRCLTAQRHSHTTAMTAILHAIATSTSEPGPLLARPVLRATPTVPRRPRPPRAPVFHCLRSARDRCMHGGFRGLSRGRFAFRPLVWRQPRGETSDDEGALSVQRACPLHAELCTQATADAGTEGLRWLPHFEPRGMLLDLLGWRDRCPKGVRVNAKLKPVFRQR